MSLQGCLIVGGWKWCYILARGVIYWQGVLMQGVEAKAESPPCNVVCGCNVVSLKSVVQCGMQCGRQCGCNVVCV